MDEMQSKSDFELLREYADTGSEAAFTELVARYTDLVYSAAVRQTSSPDLARDVCQGVFTDLARKAAGLASQCSESASLAGWLYRATRFAALNLRRGEQRRQLRERQAMNEWESISPQIAPNWVQLRPLLDDAMEELEDADREAILLRFFRNEDLRAIGAALGISDDAAQKRVSRAVDRLRQILAGRGIAAGSIGLAGVLSVNSVQAAPPGLAAAFSNAAMTGASATGATVSFWKIMALTKIKLGLAAAIVVAGVTASVVIQRQAQAEMRVQDELGRRQSEQIAKLKAEHGLASNNGGPDINNPAALEKMRAEVAGLRKQKSDLAALHGKNGQTHDPKNTDRMKTPLEDQEDSNATIVEKEKMDLTRRWNLAALMYANDNQSQLPTNFDAAASYFSNTNLDTNLSLGQFELAFQGSLKSITNPSQTIIIRELDAVQTSAGNWVKAYGFADGHSEIHSEPNNDFNAFEASHGGAR